MTLFRNALKYALLSFVISIALVGSDLLIPSIHLINLKCRDFFFHLKYVFFAVPDEAKKIVLIALDDETLEKLSTRWPYPRSFYAQILDRLKPHQPKAIGFDLVFSGNDVSEGSDQIFSKALTEAGNVVIAAHKSKEGEVGPSPLIRQTAPCREHSPLKSPLDRDCQSLLPFPPHSGCMATQHSQETLNLRYGRMPYFIPTGVRSFHSASLRESVRGSAGLALAT